MKQDDFEKILLNVYRKKEAYLKEQYDRSLSFQDGFFDRFERARILGFGHEASIYNSALVFGTVRVGIKTWVGPYVILDGSGGYIDIGEYCSISAGVHIYTHDSVMWALSGGAKNYKKANVAIGSKTYIGAHSIIKAGVTIGSSSVVAANSFVHSDVEENSIVGGSPAKTIGRVILSGDEIKLDYFSHSKES